MRSPVSRATRTMVSTRTDAATSVDQELYERLERAARAVARRYGTSSIFDEAATNSIDPAIDYARKKFDPDKGDWPAWVEGSVRNKVKQRCKDVKKLVGEPPSRGASRRVGSGRSGQESVRRARTNCLRSDRHVTPGTSAMLAHVRSRRMVGACRGQIHRRMSKHCSRAIAARARRLEHSSRRPLRRARQSAPRGGAEGLHTRPA